MQVIWRKSAPDILQIVIARLHWFFEQLHASFFNRFIGFAKIAMAASGHHIGPLRATAKRARHDMIEGELLGRERIGAILAGKPVSQKHIKARKSGPSRYVNIFF